MAKKVDHKEMIEDIRSSARARNGIELTGWESDFMDNVEKRVAEGKDLSSKQLESLEEIWDRV